MEPVHLHKDSLSNGFNVVLLLIPALVFFLILFIYLSSIDKNVYSISTEIEPTHLTQEVNPETRVLGEEDEKRLDNFENSSEDYNIQ